MKESRADKSFRINGARPVVQFYLQCCQEGLKEPGTIDTVHSERTPQRSHGSVSFLNHTIQNYYVKNN